MVKLLVKEPEKIQAKIALNGYNNKSFSELIGVTPQHLSSVLRAKKNPSPALAMKIAESINESISDIFFTNDG